MTDQAELSGVDRILTWPNVISAIRLACLPFFLYLLFGLDDRAGAAVLLGVLATTDWVDGYIARRYQQVTTLGKVLDPVADRLLFFVGIGAILVVGAAPVVFSVLVLVREVLVSVAVIALAAMGAKRIDVTWFGKAGTFCLMFTFPMFLLASDDSFPWPGFGEFLAWGVGIVGFCLSYYAAALYVPIGLAALREGRSARRAGVVGGGS